MGRQEKREPLSGNCCEFSSRGGELGGAGIRGCLVEESPDQAEHRLPRAGLSLKTREPLKECRLRRALNERRILPEPH